MKFVVSRASMSKCDQPCEDARKGTILSDEEEPMQYENEWCVEINTLEELMKFIKKYDDCVIIEKSYWTNECYEIIIYDDYIE